MQQPILGGFHKVYLYVKGYNIFGEHIWLETYTRICLIRYKYSYVPKYVHATLYSCKL